MTITLSAALVFAVLSGFVMQLVSAILVGKIFARMRARLDKLEGKETPPPPWIFK